jgi:hypothetical protein
MRKIFTIAEVPDDLDAAWLQHLRDFDTAHPDCHFQVISESDADSTMDELQAKFASISPSFPFQRIFKRGE